MYLNTKVVENGNDCSSLIGFIPLGMLPDSSVISIVVVMEKEKPKLYHFLSEKFISIHELEIIKRFPEYIPGIQRCFVTLLKVNILKFKISS